MASIVDVAKHAHVGVGTVSRVLTGKGYVSESTREKVLKSVKELNYVPNELARSLIQNKTGKVAVIVPDLTNLFYTSFVDEVEYHLRKKGYKTLLCNSFGKESNEETYLSMIDQNLVDGIITASNLLSNTSYAKITRPIVSLDSVLSPSIPMVCSDHISGGYEAARVLIEAGCKNIIQFRDEVDLDIKNHSSEIQLTLHDFPYVTRHIEFEKEVRKANITYHDFQTKGTSDFSSIRELTLNAFEAVPDVDGIMATDVLAISCASVAMEKGIKIPEDLKIVAYDGTDYLDLFYPKLSRVIQPISDLAYHCVDTLHRLIEDLPLEANRIVLPISVDNYY